MVYCSACGEEVGEVNFCPECGQKKTGVDVEDQQKGGVKVSKGFACLSNFLIPGTGYLYLNRKTPDSYLKKKAMWAIVIWIIGVITTPIGIGFLILAILMCYALYDSFVTAETLEDQLIETGAI